MANPIKIVKTLLKAEQEIAEYVISPGGNPFERWYKDKFKQRCDEFANLPGWARALSGASGGSISRMCQPHWDEQSTDGPVNPGPPFTGGQCPISYRVTASGQTANGAGTGQAFVSGPVGGLTFAFNAQNNVFSVRVVQGNGTSVALSGVSSLNPGQQGSWSITSVVPFPDANVPDNCGDPPDAPLEPGPNPPPNPGPLPGPEPTDDPDGGPIPFIPIPPYEDPTYGPQPFIPDEPGGGGPGGEPQPPSGGDGLPGADDAVGDPAGGTGTDGEGEDVNFGPPPEGRVWVGALVEFTVDPRYGNIPGTGPANTVYPYVIGNASLRYSTGRSSSSRVRSRWHEMFRPVTTLVVEGAFIQARPGCSASVRPVSAIICPDNPCGEDNDG